MSVRIEVLDAEGTTVDVRRIDRGTVVVGGAPDDDVVVRGLPPAALRVATTAEGSWVDAGGGRRLDLTAGERTVLRIGEVALAVTRLALGPDACPRCGGRVTDRAIGGAYRAVVSREQSCSACGTTVLELGQAERLVGAFAEVHEASWVAIYVPMYCPRCRNPFTRSVFRTAAGEAPVERCIPCHLVVLDPQDRSLL